MQINWVSWCTVHTDTLTFQPVTLVQQHVPSADTNPEWMEAGSCKCYENVTLDGTNNTFGDLSFCIKCFKLFSRSFDKFNP